MIYEPKGKAAEYAFLAVNHYTGCVGGCDYPCYMADMFRKKKVQPPFDQPRAKANVVKLTRRAAQKYQDTTQRVQLCFSTDPYQPLDRKLKLTRSVLEIFDEFNIPFQVLTKFGPAAEWDFDLYKPTDMFGCTIISTHPDWTGLHEPGTASYMDRCSALIGAKNKGIQTWLSLEPVIDADEAIKVIQYTRYFVDLYKIGKVNYADSDIDWNAFALRAVEMCNRWDKKYYLKESLAAELKADEFINTDWREIEN